MLLIMGLMVAWTAVGRCQSAEPVSAASTTPAKASADMQHSAEKALWLSLLPGAGQIYNGQAWKLPIIYGAFAGVGYLIYDNYKDMKLFKDEYLESGDFYKYNMYQAKNKSFQLFIIVAAAVYGLNLVDAYVFGHLYDFQINDDLALQLSPSLTPDFNSSIGMAPSLQLSFRF